MQLSALVVIAAARSGLAVSLFYGSPPAQLAPAQLAQKWFNGNISLWMNHKSKSMTHKMSGPEDEFPYEGSGCEDWCTMEGNTADMVPCDIPPCEKCGVCGATGSSFEVRSINIGGVQATGPQKFMFTAPFKQIPVVAVLATTRGGHPVIVRVANVTKESFHAVLTEPSGEDGPHMDMDVSFMAALPGSHPLPDGSIVEAHVISTKKQVLSWRCKESNVPVAQWEQVDFESTYVHQPVVVAQLQTMSNEDRNVPQQVSVPFLATTVKEVTTIGVKVAMERAEVSNRGDVVYEEKIGILVMAPGNGQFTSPSSGLIGFAAVHSDRRVEGWNKGGNDVQLGVTLGSPNPLVVAGMCSRNGGDGGWVRLKRSTPSKVVVTIDEDRHCDGERWHTTEEVCVMAWSAAFTV